MGDCGGAYRDQLVFISGAVVVPDLCEPRDGRRLAARGSAGVSADDHVVDNGAAGGTFVRWFDCAGNESTRSKARAAKFGVCGDSDSDAVADRGRFFDIQCHHYHRE